MHRFYVPPLDCQKDEFELRAQDARHALNVLRLVDGNEVEVLNGRGDVLRARILASSRRCVTVKVESRIHRPTASAPPPKNEGNNTTIFFLFFI